jgi:hypothetical protein
VLVLEDNSAVVYIFQNRTSRAPRLVAILRELIATCDLNDTELEIRYVSTHDNLADLPSRFKGVDHWRLRPDVFHAVQHHFGCRHTVDRFASKATALLPRYNTPHPQPGSEGVDGLAQSWDLEDNWIHPPPGLLTQVAARVEREPHLHGTVVTPYWPAEQWFSSLRAASATALVVPNAASLV